MDGVDPDIVAALRDGGVADRFAALSPSHRREYLTWIAAARQPATRARRIAGTVERLAAGA